MYSDDKILVYVGYPSEVISKPPSWVESMVRSFSQDQDSPFHFYLSGGAITPKLFPLLKSRAVSKTGAQKLAMKLVHGYTSRLIDPILSSDIEKLVVLAKENTLSTEYRILLDLWVLSRSDIYVVDCDLLGRGRCGMEALYAHDTVRTVGVSDSPVLDLWFQYHLDAIVKSQMCFSHLGVLGHAILANRGVSPTLNPRNSSEESPKTPEE